MFFILFYILLSLRSTMNKRSFREEIMKILFASIIYLSIFICIYLKKKEFTTKNEIYYVNIILHVSEPAVCQWSLFNFWDECCLEKARPFLLFLSSSFLVFSVYCIPRKKSVVMNFLSSVTSFNSIYAYDI
jgi:hypothetical protein